MDIFNKLIENGWLTEEEIETLINNKDILECIKSCTSPGKENIFNALEKVSTNSIKVLILGKDPYPNPKDAHGLAFSSLDKSTPDSLKNIFKSIDEVYGSSLFINAKNDLTKWAEEGVLLLNTGLTYKKVECANLTKKERDTLQNKTQNTHMKVWRPFINKIIQKILNIKDRPVVMLLWGNDAHNIVFGNIKDKEFKKYLHDRGANIVPDTKILVLQCAHPSPLSVNRGGDFPTAAPFQFKECDKHLGADKINWTKL